MPNPRSITQALHSAWTSRSLRHKCEALLAMRGRHGSSSPRALSASSFPKCLHSLRRARSPHYASGCTPDAPPRFRRFHLVVRALRAPLANKSARFMPLVQRTATCVNVTCIDVACSRAAPPTPDRTSASAHPRQTANGGVRSAKCAEKRVFQGIPGGIKRR